MPSLFPGMDPYLEGSQWPDIHSAFASEIRGMLNEFLPTDLVARLEVSLLTDQLSIIGETVRSVPDVKISERGKGGVVEEPPSSYGTLTPPTGEDDIEQFQQRKQLTVVILSKDNPDHVIAAIEIVSPANKYGEGLRKYREKRQRYLSAEIHLLEIDLIRRGTRAHTSPTWPNSTYLVQLANCHDRKLRYWAFRLDETLPTVRLPLRTPDESVIVKLNVLFQSAYRKGGYLKAYASSMPLPPPALPPVEQRFLDSLRS